MKKKHRSAITGEFVTKEYADLHPDSTIGEQVKKKEGTKETERKGRRNPKGKES